MRCRGCDYSLNELMIGICPECGRAFDRADPTSFVSDGEVRDATMLARAAVFAGAWPLMLTLWLYASYFVARLVLGRWPGLSGQDDPKGIAIVRGMHSVGAFVWLMTPAIVVVGVFALLGVWAHRWRLGVLVSALIATLLGAAWLLLISVDVWGWFFD